MPCCDTNREQSLGGSQKKKLMAVVDDGKVDRESVSRKFPHIVIDSPSISTTMT